MTYSSCKNKGSVILRVLKKIHKRHTKSILLNFLMFKDAVITKKDFLKFFNNVKTNIYSCIHKTAQ